MGDITGAEIVDVHIRADGKVLWVNTEKGCVLRICQIGTITVEDLRSKKQKEKNKAGAMELSKKLGEVYTLDNITEFERASKELRVKLHPAVLEGT